MRQSLLPVFGNQARLAVQRVGVAGQGERGHIGVEPVDDGAGLLARAGGFA